MNNAQQPDKTFSTLGINIVVCLINFSYILRVCGHITGVINQDVMNGGRGILIA